MTEDASPENLRKFLESDDPAMRRMGLSMAKGAGVPEEMLGLVAGLYMWHDDKGVRAAAKSTFMKHAPDELKNILKGTWNTSYRTVETEEALKPKVETMFQRFRDTPLDAVDVWVPALSRSAGDKVAIVSVLVTFGEPAVEPLIKVLGEGNSYAAWALGGIGGARAVELLIEVLGNEDDDVRKFAVIALGVIGNERAVEPLICVLSDDKQWVRAAAAEALGKIGKLVVEPLIEMLGDEDYDVRKRATEVLGWIGDVRAIEPLIKMLSDEDSDVRSPTAHALGNIGDKRAVEPLIKALGDEDGYVRWGVAIALGQIGDVQAIEPLIKALEGGNSGAVEALKMIEIQRLQSFITAGKENELTVPELKTILKEKNLPVSGTKSELIERLKE